MNLLGCCCIVVAALLLLQLLYCVVLQEFRGFLAIAVWIVYHERTALAVAAFLYWSVTPTLLLLADYFRTISVLFLC